MAFMMTPFVPVSACCPDSWMSTWSNRSGDRLMFVRFELMYMLPMRRPSIIETPSAGRLPFAETCAPVWSPSTPPTSTLLALTAGTSAAIWIHDPPEGSSLNAWSVTCRVVAADCRSTMGLSPVTVMVSSTAPTRMSASTFDVKFTDTWSPSRFTVEKPGSVKLTV
jgi:hypothetical protein